MSLPAINDRLDLVEEMLEYPQLQQDLVNHLRRTFDTLRLVQKFSFGRGDADDLVELSKTILRTADIAALVAEHSTSRNAIPLDSKENEAEIRRRGCLSSLSKRFDFESPMRLANRIAEAIDEYGLSEHHRLEDDEENAVVEMAQEILSQEAGEEDLKQMPKKIRPKPNAIAPSFKTATDGREDIWIMKRRYGHPSSAIALTLSNLM
jgi:DNA mismatch repair ATPase MutS